jgi:hypothetical protein
MTTTLPPRPAPGAGDVGCADLAAGFGPNSLEVRALLDQVRTLTPGQLALLAAHAPIVTVHGPRTEMFCPNADASSYGNLARYRRLARAHHDPTDPGRRFYAQVGRVLEELAPVIAGLPVASGEAVLDAVIALVTRGGVHEVAYDTLTRAVRQALGPIHPGDVALRR